MELKNILVEAGAVGNGNIVVIDTAEIKGLDADLPVQFNFAADRVVGTAKIRREGGCLWADIKITDKKFAGEYWPAIGFTVQMPEQQRTEDNGSPVRIDKYAVNRLGLCTNPNVDPNIPFITIIQ